MSLAGKKTCYIGQQDGKRCSLEEADDEEESSPLMMSPEASSDQSGATNSPNTAANQHQHHRHHNNINNNYNNDNNNSNYSNSNNVSSTHHTYTGAKASTSAIASEMSTSNSVASSHATNLYHRTVFEVLYLGSATIDKRYSSPHFVMPWVVAEVKRKTDGFREIRLEVRDISLRGVQVLSTSADSSEHAKHIRATSPNTNTTYSAIQSTAALPSLSSQECQGDSNTLQTDTKEFIVFEHKLQGVSRFAESHQEPRCFAYLTRPQLNSDFHCHVFMAPEENQVSKTYIYSYNFCFDHHFFCMDGHRSKRSSR